MSLPRLPNIKQLSPCVSRILGQNPGGFTLQGTNTYLIGTSTTNKRLLVDCGDGLPEYTKLLSDHLKSQELELGAILITHWHHDHLNGAPVLLEELNLDIPVYKYPSPGHDFDDLKIDAVKDNDTLELFGVKMTLLHTPGHADDHLVVWVHNDKVLLSADNVLGHGTSSYEDYRLYMNSLQRMAQLPELGHIFPGHGEVIDDGPAKIREYIDHRRQREHQVLDLVRQKGPITAEQITQTIYSDVPPNVLVAAQRGVDQFLIKLVHDQKVRSKDQLYSKF